MECQKCRKNFNRALASCGTGWTWSLYKCPHCGQKYASGNIIPKVVLEDESIIKLGEKWDYVKALKNVCKEKEVENGETRKDLHTQ